MKEEGATARARVYRGELTRSGVWALPTAHGRLGRHGQRVGRVEDLDIPTACSLVRLAMREAADYWRVAVMPEDANELWRRWWARTNGGMHPRPFGRMIALGIAEPYWHGPELFIPYCAVLHIPQEPALGALLADGIRQAASLLACAQSRYFTGSLLLLDAGGELRYFRTHDVRR